MRSFVPGYLDETARAYLQMSFEDRKGLWTMANLSTDFRTCSMSVVEYFLIKSGFGVLDWMRDDQKRELLEVLWSNKNATVGLMRRLLAIWNVELVTVMSRSSIRYNGEQRHDASVTRNTDRAENYWYEFSVVSRKSLTSKQRIEIGRIIDMIKPVRSKLIEFAATEFVGHDKSIMRDGTYRYGGL